MSLPLLPCPCPPADYNASFERALARAKALGAEACAFGDIDIPDHRQWDEERCAAAGLSCLLPLWGEGRAALAREGVEAGFRAVIKLVRLDCLDVSFLGPDAGRGHPGRHRGHRRGYLRGKRGIPHPGHRRPFVPPSPARAPRPGHPLRHPRRHGFSPAIKNRLRIHCSWSAKPVFSVSAYIHFIPAASPLVVYRCPTVSLWP